MKKIIRKNSTKKIETILKNIVSVTVHTYKNNYQGEKITLQESEIKQTKEDILSGHAVLTDVGNNTFHIKYAGKCFWELRGV
jgi:hypothetical protein